MAEGKNFFERWGRRPDADGQTTAPLAPAQESDQAGVQGAAPPGDPAAAPPQAPADSPERPLTLADAERLTPKDNFAPFVARQVPSAVRNAAMKKLFADPHFNVMDGLDIYIDDYSLPSPLSPAMMAKMVSAQVMKLVPDPADALNAAAGSAPAHAASATASSEAPNASDALAPEAEADGEAQPTQADGPAAAQAEAMPPAQQGLPSDAAQAPPAAQTSPVDGAEKAAAESASPAAPAAEPTPHTPPASAPAAR